jgi:hypothetical protein
MGHTTELRRAIKSMFVPEMTLCLAGAIGSGSDRTGRGLRDCFCSLDCYLLTKSWPNFPSFRPRRSALGSADAHPESANHPQPISDPSSRASRRA